MAKQAEFQEQLELFKTNLPQKPYCTDILSAGLSILPAQYALKKRYIQHNSPNDLRWLVYDVDRCTSIYDWDDLGAPAPNIIAWNRENGHSHLFYGLEVPVYQQMSAHKGPMRYAAAADIALTLKLEADQSYGKLISKNPLHNKAWQVSILEQYSYDLPWLCDYLDLGKMADLRTRLPQIGLGRNCNIFDSTRRWAYREVRYVYLSYDLWADSIFARANYLNVQLENPLPYSEIKAIGTSVAKWVWKNMSAHGFQKWSENRRAKSAKVRQEKSQDRAKKGRIFQFQGLTPREIAEGLNISRRQLYRLNPERGEQLRHRGQELQEHAHQLRGQGFKQQGIAKALNISQSQVSKLLGKNIPK